MSGEPYEPVENSMRCNLNAVQIGVFGDPLQFRDAANILRIGTNYVDSLLFNQILEILPQIDLLAGMNRDRGVLRDFAKQFRVGVWRIVAGDQVLQPGDTE